MAKVLKMYKQLGFSTLELLCSLAIISSFSAFTLEMAKEVETSISEYQQTVDIKKIRAKIQSAESPADNS